MRLVCVSSCVMGDGGKFHVCIRYDEKCFSFKSLVAFGFYVFLFNMSVCAFCRTRNEKRRKAQTFFSHLFRL